MTHKIGDIEPLEHAVDPEEIKSINARRRHNNALISGSAIASNMQQHAALKAINESRQAEFRQRDPFEQCKTWLRSRGYIPVASLPGIGHRVGRRTFQTEEEVFAFAAERGWGRC